VQGEFGLKVLVVEDYSPIRKAVEVTLRESGYVVDCATDGLEGYLAATNGGYDCIVLDWMLPKMSGLDMLNRLRQASDQTPIFMLTAKNTIDDRI